MGTVSLTDPVNGTVIDATLHASNNAALEAVINGGLDTSNLSSAANISDLQLASANNSVYRHIVTQPFYFPGGVGAGTFLFSSGGGRGASGSGDFSTAPPPVLNFAGASYIVNGTTMKMRLQGWVGTNNTAPTQTYTWGLYPITSVAGGAGALTITLGTVISGSTIASGTLSASAATMFTGSDFAAPADGDYVIGCVTSGTQAANSVVSGAFQIFYHHT